jgi:hypothetical protein
MKPGGGGIYKEVEEFGPHLGASTHSEELLKTCFCKAECTSFVVYLGFIARLHSLFSE